MLTTDEIVDLYRNLGKAELSLAELKMKDARTRLIGAARNAGVRVAVRRDADRNVAIATVLTNEEAAIQARRAAIYRAVAQLRGALEILTTELDNTAQDENKELIADLTDIASELEGIAS